MKKRVLVGISFAAAILAAATVTFVTLFHGQNVNASPVVTVYKSPTCGCCNNWVKHLEDNGFEVTTVDLQDVNPIKRKFGIVPNLSSCHTAIVDGYAIEGHVPAQDVKRLLAEKPDVIGISVPGMPVGSPGMEMGNRIDAYSVVIFDKNGNVNIYSRY